MRELGYPPLLKERIAYDAYMLAQSLGCSLIQRAPYEYPSGMPALPPEYHLCGASVKIAEHGTLAIEFHKHKKTIPILEIRIEEDTGRLIHADGKTFMDYTCAGMPSIRIRTGNNIELGEEAETVLIELSSRLRYIGLLSDSDGSRNIRCNAYVASTEFPNMPQHYVKLRNLNSFNFVRKAVNEDLKRQENMIKQGKALLSESRLWNARTERTESYKPREFIDYVKTIPAKELYFYTVPEHVLQDIFANAPENQQARRLRYIHSLGLSMPAARALCTEVLLADFFDAVLKYGIEPKTAANSILEDVLPLLKRTRKTINTFFLEPERFAYILQLVQAGTINHTIVCTLLQKIIIDGISSETLFAQDAWIKISDDTTLRSLVQNMLIHHQKEVELLKAGNMKYLDILCGLVMKQTKGFADQQAVKQIIKGELNIRIIYVFSMGGAISGEVKNGQVEAGHAKILSELLDPNTVPCSIHIEDDISDSLFSEELEPADWARLIHAICKKLSSGTANGIVITHGTDTLIYTAPLIYWLFADTPVPIVLTASNRPPTESEEAQRNFNDALKLAWEKEHGVYVAFNGNILSPLNLKYVDPAHTGFTNWNMRLPLFQGEGLLSDYAESDSLVFESLLSEASDAMFLIKTYPGMRSAQLLSLLKEDIHIFFLELYRNGTANMKDSLYSLKAFLRCGKNQRCRFFCTSQQEEIIDFSYYESARNLWKEGAVPMGMLTTETAIALYYAASLVCDTPEELDRIMENAAMAYEK